MVILTIAAWFVAGVLLHLGVWLWWWPQGRDVLFVYSDSPVWSDYIEASILPSIRQRAIIMNWSERRKWPAGLAWAAFRYFGGAREFNPLAVVFRPFAQVFRFWQPFHAWKHGRGDLLERTEAEFFRSAGLKRPGRTA